MHIFAGTPFQDRDNLNPLSEPLSGVAEYLLVQAVEKMPHIGGSLVTIQHLDAHSPPCVGLAALFHRQGDGVRTVPRLMSDKVMEAGLQLQIIFRHRYSRHSHGLYGVFISAGYSTGG